MQLRNTVLAVGLITGFGFLLSCKKDDIEKKVDAPQPPPPVQSKPLTEAELKDSALIYTRDIYLWYKQIPSGFNAQIHADPDAMMTAIRSYSNEPGYAAAVDRWSHAMKKTEWDNQSMGLSMAAEESDKGFGLEVFFRAQNDLRVRHVEKESPAGLAGVRRGWRITKLNGSTNMTTSNSNAIVSGVYESSSGTFTFQKPDGTTADITLKATTYREQPVVLDSVYTVGSKKAGYLVFNSFLGDTTRIYNDLQRVFSRFSQQQVNEVIIDLRYNSGGYVSVQERLANYLISPGYNGQVMMTEQFNDKYSRYNRTMRFAKLGSLNVSRVFFIVSSSTASAGELLINNLKPYMEVRLVGPSATHGKPVGFFPLPVGDWYIFPVSFRSINKNGEGNYFNGLPLNNQAADGLDKDWGDSNESSLGFILNGLRSGAYRSASPETSIDPQMEAINSKFSRDQFKGMVDTRPIF